MKTKTALITFSITALLMIIILIILEAYFIAAALVVGLLVLSHRKLWSLIMKRELPPIDERVRENTSKSIRNSFLFFCMVAVLTMIFYFTDKYEPIQPSLEYFLGGLLLSVGVVYVVSYLFYDRVEVNLDRKRSKKFMVFSWVSGISLIVFIINAFFVNTIFPSIEFLAFHRILLYVSPFVFALGITVSMIIFMKGLFARP